jgi:hypothetical protein
MVEAEIVQWTATILLVIASVRWIVRELIGLVDEFRKRKQP